MNRLGVSILILVVLEIIFLSVMLYQANLCDHYGAKNALTTEYSAECLVEASEGRWMSRAQHEKLTMALIARGVK